MRTFSSSLRSVASPDLISVLISITKTVRLAACQAAMSIEPDARYVAYVASICVTQPAASSISTILATRFE